MYQFTAKYFIFHYYCLASMITTNRKKMFGSPFFLKHKFETVNCAIQLHKEASTELGSSKNR